MSTAVLDQNTFPNCTNGDVKVVLSENSDDTLMLNASVLAKDSPFFKASIERIEWSHNKMLRWRLVEMSRRCTSCWSWTSMRAIRFHC